MLSTRMESSLCLCTAANARGFLIHDQGSWALQNTNYKIHLCDNTSLKTQAEALPSDFLTFRTKHRQSETLKCKDPAKLSKVKVRVNATGLPETLDEICCNSAKHLLIPCCVGTVS